MHVQNRLAPHHLHRLFEGIPRQAGAQDVMAVDHLLQRLGERFQLFTAGKAEHRVLLVRIALVGDVVIQQAFLQRRQWVDLLHIGGAAGDRGDDAFYRRRVQFGQRQQVRSNQLATRRNTVGRHIKHGALANRCRQCGQGRLAEQHLHVGLQPDLAHVLHQLDRQQRMAAQLEEMVMPPYLLDVQHVGPDLRQGDFRSTFWGLVDSTDKCIGTGCRQGLAVEFAVGRQGQRVQLYVGLRHHVIRQA